MNYEPHTPSFAPTNHPYTLFLYLFGRSVGEPMGVGGGGRGAELFNQPPYVGVEHRSILAAKAQCHIRIPFIRFSILLSLIL